jgi:hypothetical protein
VITRIGFQLVDDSSLFDIGARKMFYDAKAGKKAGTYVLDTVFYFHRPFGMLVDCFDKMRDDGMRQAVHRLLLYIDNKLFYEVAFDSLDFATTRSVQLEYDYVEAVDEREYARTVFKKAGNDYTGSRPSDGSRGVFGLRGDERIGAHQAKIVAEDLYGNSAELTFEFLWGPPGDVFALDSVLTGPPETTYFHLSPVVDPGVLEIDSAVVYRNRAGAWGRPSTVDVTTLTGGRLECRVVGHQTPLAVLKLFLYTRSGCLIRDVLFNGLQHHGKETAQLSHDVLEDGLLVVVRAYEKVGSRSRLELYYRNTLLGIEYPQFFNMNAHVCFIPPRPEYARVDSIAVAMSADTTYPTKDYELVNIAAVGYLETEDVQVGRFLTLHVSKRHFHRPRFIEWKESTLLNRSRFLMNSPYYEIFPEAFVCREDFQLRLKLPHPSSTSHLSGLCWLDKEEDHWVWLDDNTFSNDTLTATSTGGGLFAAVLDVSPPEIKYLSLSDGGTYSDLTPAVNFVIDDTLSGIGSDEDIIIKLDGEWLIPEYDPETGLCRSKPLQPLPPGRHHLGIRVRDRAGNLAEQYLNFYVRGPGKRGRQR